MVGTRQIVLEWTEADQKAQVWLKLHIKTQEIGRQSKKEQIPATPQML